MTVYKYLGWGITNENGVAKLDHDADGIRIDNSYTGVGAGEIDVVASLDNPIVDGSIVSKTYSIYDCYKYDSGTDPSNTMWALNANAKLTRGSEYSTLEENTIGTTATITLTGINLTNYRVECDIYQVDGTTNENALIIYDSNWSPLVGIKGSIGEWKHISQDLTNVSANSICSILTGASDTKLYFKDFKIYPI